jgi:hypothetical protein
MTSRAEALRRHESLLALEGAEPLLEARQPPSDLCNRFGAHGPRSLTQTTEPFFGIEPVPDLEVFVPPDMRGGGFDADAR